MSITIQKGYTTRTRKCIIDALFSLLETDHFDDITILQITQEAEIARRTFYLNYSSKKDVLEDYIKYLYIQFLDSVPADNETDFHTDVLNFFSFWKDHTDILIVLKNNDQFPVLLDVFEKILVDSDRFNFENIGLLNHDDKRKLSYIVAMTSAGLWRALKKWVDDGMVDDVTMLSELFFPGL